MYPETHILAKPDPDFARLAKSFRLCSPRASYDLFAHSIHVPHVSRFDKDLHGDLAHETLHFIELVSTSTGAVILNLHDNITLAAHMICAELNPKQFRLTRNRKSREVDP